MADTDQVDAPIDEEVEEKGEALEDQFAAADAEADVEVTPPTLEDLAVDLGWKPQDKFRGPPERWKPAAEFIKDGRNESRNLKAKLDEMRETMANVAKTTGAIMQEKLQEQHDALKQKYASAVERGDADEAWKVGNEIRDLKDKTVQAQPEGPQLSRDDMEYAAKWRDRNPWLDTHPVAKKLAVAIADEFALNGASAEVQCREAEAVVRSQFPHLFKDAETPANVNGVRSRGAQRTPRGTAYKDMPKEAQSVADDLLDRGLIDDKERYARNYFAQAQKGQ